MASICKHFELGIYLATPWEILANYGTTVWQILEIPPAPDVANATELRLTLNGLGGEE